MFKPPSEPLSKSPWKVPGYCADRMLGRGGSGEVWQGRVTRTGEAVALKRIPLGDPGQRAAARIEASVLSALEHPHLVRLHELVRTDDAVILVLDLADAGSLADLLRRRSRLTAGEVVTALAPIGAALAYAHTAGIVHGDVSAANVLFTSIGLPLLADLGVARIIGDDGPVRSTPAYLDPVVANGYLPGPVTDVFCLAAVAVHALRGRPLWPGSTAAEMIEAATAASTAGTEFDLAALLAGTPESLRDVLARALAIAPARRCTASEFALDLRHSLTPIPVELRAGRVARHAASPSAGAAVAAVVSGQSVQAAQSVSSVQSGLLTYGRAVAPISRPTRSVRAHRRARELTRRTRVSSAQSAQSAQSGRAARAARPAPPVRTKRRRLGLVSVVVGTFVAVAGLLLAWPATGVTRSGSAGPVTASPVAAGSVLNAPAGVVIVNATTAASVLAGLDQFRERAFAQHDAGLLGQVYESDDLVREDAATLDALAGPGCALAGARTDYRNVRLVSSTVDKVVVVATASVAASVLTCATAAPRPVAGVDATTLRIELTRTASGRYLISALQRE